MSEPQNSPASGARRPWTLRQSDSLRSLQTIIRDRNATQRDFVLTARRIVRLLIELALENLPYAEAEVETPSGGVYTGCRLTVPFCGVSVLRAGDSMEAELREIYPEAPIGKILIQRDKITKEPIFYYLNLPKDIAGRHVLLLDPMLATGGTANLAVEKLISHGVPSSRIILVTLLSVSVGYEAVWRRFPEVSIVTACIEKELNTMGYMVPGIGDFGDRYFGA